MNNPQYNPGIKSDKGRIILLIIAVLAAIGFMIGSQEVEKIMTELDLTEEAMVEPEVTKRIIIEPDLMKKPVVEPDFIENIIIKPDFGTEETKKILRKSQTEVIEKLEEQGLYEQVDEIEKLFEKIKNPNAE